MKIIQYVILFFLFFSCSNEFTLIEEPKDIPIIYGILDLTDTAQYIRVERAFVDESTSALELALDPNNLYYPNAEVTLTKIADNSTFTLEKVDGDNEGLPRREGIFAQSPNTLYKIRTDELNMVEGEEYQLSVKRDETLPLVTAETILVEEGNIIRPNSSGKLDFSFVNPTTFRWRQGDNAFLFDVAITVHYQERDQTQVGTGFERKSKVWNVTSGVTVDEIQVDGIKFYEFMNGSLEANPNLIRRFLYVDFTLFSGGKEIEEYISVGQANLGITSSQDIPTFTNLSEGRGLFSSRTSLSREQIELTVGTLDSLVNGSITADLNFEF